MPGEHAYFVGRRRRDAAEVYVVGTAGVKRLRSRRGGAGRGLDWRGDAATRMELGGVIISHAAEVRPTRDLRERFALYVLDRLPESGFVLDFEDVARWVRVASDHDDFVCEHREHQPLHNRLLSLVRGIPTPRAHA